jgi:hypothetical protein
MDLKMIKQKFGFLKKIPFEQILKLAKCLKHEPYDNLFNTYIWHNHAQNL